MTIINDIQSWQAQTFPNASQGAAAHKIAEEYGEWIDASDDTDDRNETGDLLVATIGYARVMGWDVEQLLCDTLAKCESRKYVDGERVK